jgi:hypothetical protein
MKRILMTVIFAAAVATMALADGGGMGGMGGGMMGGGSGMLAIADDNSVLVTEMGMGGMMGGSGELERELINIGPDGQERWRVTFDEGWPMMPVTEADLVVLTLADDAWMGGGGMGDGGWNHGGMGGLKTLDGEGDGTSTVIGLDLATGQERWRLILEGDMISMPQFTEDGSRLYLTARDMGRQGQVGGDPMHQGNASGSGMLMSSTLVAVDRSGNILWTVDLSDGHMGGPMAGEGS